MTDIADRIGEVIQKALAVSSVVQGREVYVKLTDLHEVVARLQALKTKARYAERAAAEADAKVCPLAIADPHTPCVLAQAADERADHLREVLTEAREFIDGYSDVVDGSYGEPEPNRAMTLVSIIDAALATEGK
jgi:hypothetical protein